MMKLNEFKMHLKSAIASETNKVFDCYNLLDTVTESKNPQLKQMYEHLMRTFVKNGQSLGYSVITKVFRYLCTTILPQVPLPIRRNTVMHFFRWIDPNDEFFKPHVDNMLCFMAIEEKSPGGYPKGIKSMAYYISLYEYKKGKPIMPKKPRAKTTAAKGTVAKAKTKPSATVTSGSTTSAATVTSGSTTSAATASTTTK